MSPRPPKAVEPWSDAVGALPHRVIVEEVLSRRGGLYLRWWDAARGNWAKKSLGNIRAGKPLRDEKGRIDPAVTAWATAEAAKQYVALTGGEAPASAVVRKPFTIGETWKAISDPEKGRYPHKTDFRDELKRALEYAGLVWGSARAWEQIGEEDWQQLMRRRVTELVARRLTGVRATEITISRLITAVRWLRKTKRIPAGAAEAPDDWKADLVAFWKGLTKTTRDPEPKRPRFTQDEALAILAVSWEVDQRFGLLLDLGAEYRLGQVARCRRSDLNLKAQTLTVHGAGKKGGETIDLTDGQLASLARAMGPGGYLEERERRYQADPSADYDLIPGGKLRTKRVPKGRGAIVTGTWRGEERPVRPDTIRKWFREAEDKARVDEKPIPHIDGRGAYGIRRVHVDIANREGISRHGLKAAGGWSSTKIPDEVYAEQENRVGRAEAKAVRSRWRRENVTAEPQSEAPSDAPSEAGSGVSAPEPITSDAVHTSYAVDEMTANDPTE